MSRPAACLAVAAALVLAQPSRAEAPADPCPSLRSLEGSWWFTTVVTSATQRGAVGVDGYYALRVAAAGGSALDVEVDKTGFGKHEYAAPLRSTVARATSCPEGVAPAGVACARVQALFERPGKPPLELARHLWRSGESLAGAWRYQGASWQESQMLGGLAGARGPARRHALSAGQLAAEARCATECLAGAPCTAERLARCAFDLHQAHYAARRAPLRRCRRSWKRPSPRIWSCGRGATTRCWSPGALAGAPRSAAGRSRRPPSRSGRCHASPTHRLGASPPSPRPTTETRPSMPRRACCTTAARPWGRST